VHENPGIATGARLKIAGAYYLVQGVVNMAGLNRMWDIDVTEDI
jgi:hypothetical protein